MFSSGFDCCAKQSKDGLGLSYRRAALPCTAAPPEQKKYLRVIDPSLPSNESERLAELWDLDILDTPAESVFDEIATLAAAICGTPYAAITFIDKDRQWLKARHGLEVTQTAREESVCAHAILDQGFFEVPDLQQDTRFSGNPLLELGGGSRMRFYGGSRLTTERGHALGMLCVLDEQPRQLTPEQRRVMAELAQVVTVLLEARRDRSRHETLGLVLDRLRVGITVLDGQTHRFVHANATALAEFGRPLEQLRQLTPPEAAPSTSAERFAAAMQRLQEGARQAVDEYEIVNAAAEPVTMEVRWERLPAQPRELVVGIARDVSERKALERMKDELVALINHELRTPVTAIRGAIKLLESGAGGALPDRAAQLVSVASQSTDRLLHIVDDLLDLDRMASQRMAFRIEPVDAAGALTHAAHAAAALAESAGVEIVVDAPAGLLLRADAQRLQQVLANLVSNATKFAPSGSRIDMRAEALREGDTREVRLTVTDHGPGVPEAFRSRIFQRFAQADARTTRAQGGSGLGLSIAKQMTEQMNGRIGFDSEPGRTTFFLNLPGVEAP